MKDRGQKEAALRYCVGKDWFPQLELDVLSDLNIADRTLKTTDVDVFASMPADFVGYYRMAIDCKTLKSQSPINRAIWLRGLCDTLQATRGISILQKAQIDIDHRYTAARLGITLLTEEEFQAFAEATTTRKTPLRACLSDLAAWDRLFEIPSHYPALRELVDFSKSYYWMMRNESEACRKTIAYVRKCSADLDPGKAEHCAIFMDAAALFMHAFAIVVANLFAFHLQPGSSEDLSNALLLYLYGGRESYEHRNQLNKIILELRRESSPQGASGDLTLPIWPTFLQLARKCLDAPFEVNRSPIILREIAMGYLSDSHSVEYLTYLANSYPQASKLAIIGAEYLAKAGKLPADFLRIAENKILQVQKPVGKV